MKKQSKLTRLFSLLVAVTMLVGVLPALDAFAVNPFLPLWERIPDGEPRVFVDPDTGLERLYVYGSHDTRFSGYCGPDHVVWSAPIDDLNNWRHEGTAFHIEQLRGANYIDRDGLTKQLNITVSATGSNSTMLYAPDVVYHPENNKYYMYVFVDGMWHANADPPAAPAGTWPYASTTWRRRHPMYVASSDHPAGPFTDPKFVYLAFDPAVLVDDVKNDDGKSRVYLYWTPEEGRDVFAAELDPDDMATMLPGTMHYPKGSGVGEGQTSLHTMPGWSAPFYAFEGASIRKFNGFYIMAYCSGNRTSQTSTSPISQIRWAYSDNPFGDPEEGVPWTPGGVVVDNRGEQIRNPYTNATTYTYTGGNIHGGMAEVNGQWYQVFHRDINTSSKRQAMAEAINLRIVDGAPMLEEVEMTSKGFEINGLDPFKEQNAGIACYMLPASGNTAPNFFTQTESATAYNFDPNAIRNDWFPVQNIRNQSWLGYKYFNFGSATASGNEIKLALTMTTTRAGTVNVYVNNPKTRYTDAEQPKTLIGTGTFAINSAVHAILVDVDSESLVGEKGVYLEFLSSTTGSEIAKLNKLQFINVNEDGPSITKFLINETTNSYTAVAGLYNFSGQVSNVQLIFAAFDSSGRFVKAVVKAKQVPVGEYMEWSASIPFEQGIDSVTAFLWDGDFVPLTGSISR